MSCKTKFCFVVLLAGICPSAFGTSVIVKLEEKRILLVADTRVEELGNGQDSFVNECKIEGRGKVALAIFGYSKFRETSPLSFASNWNGIDSFVEVSSIAQDDLAQAANLWLDKARAHLQTRYPAGADLMRHLTAQSSGLITRGVFVGWVQDRPTAIWEDIFFKDSPIEPFSGKQQILTLKTGGVASLPYATSKTSTDLLDSKTALGKEAAKRWEKAKTRFPASERDWRWLAFVIKLTSEHEKGVGPDADVLEVTRTGAKWLHTASCKIKQVSR